MPESVCYNKGCGQRFDPEKNTEDVCQFHPGPPFFHDAQKIWKCCNKRSTDFGLWMSIPGCTKGKHSTEKPNDVVRLTAQMQIRPEKEEEVVVWNGLNKPAERPVVDEKPREFIALSVVPTPGIINAIKKHEEEVKSKENDDLKIGTICSNSGCEVTYNGPDSLLLEDCKHHPGEPIFHEGMKYYSCCNRKTSDFGTFLAQEGCSKGKHKFERACDRVVNVREDWFSRSGEIHYNLYCRGSLPDLCTFECDGYQLKCLVKHAFGEKETEVVVDLFGQVIPEGSQAIVAERKIEIVLQQADNLSWPQLRYVPEETQGDAENAKSEV